MLKDIHQRFLQVLQVVFGKVVLVTSLAVDWPFGVGLRLYIGFAQAVDYDVGMDVACAVIAICMGADQSLMPRKISFCVFAKSVEVKKPMNYVEKGVSKSIAKIIESFNDRTDMIVI